MNSATHYDAIVIGAGPAGLTAGIYLSRSRFKTLILGEGTVGGQLVLTHEIANYPGVEATSGYQLANTMKKQARAFGCEIHGNVKISRMEPDQEIKSVTLANGVTYTAHALVLAPGGRPRTLNVAGEEQFKGMGISYCATCDGDFFTGKEIVVVGGGNSALEEAVSLTKYASGVTVIHQFDQFQAHPYAVEEAVKHPRIRFRMESTIEAFRGKERLEEVLIRDLKSGTTYAEKTEGAFVFIGYIPNTEFLEDRIRLNSSGEIMVNLQMETSLEGVFAAGDCVAKNTGR